MTISRIKQNIKHVKIETAVMHVITTEQYCHKSCLTWLIFYL